VCAMLTSLELTKIVADKDMLQAEYKQLRHKRDEVAPKEERVKQVVEGVHNIIPEVLREEEAPLWEHVTKLSESIQGFQTNITNLEAQQIPRTPPEERKQREKITTTSIENVKSMEV
jgi:hypothetical protein